jgi:hypothetical protein
MPEATTDPRMFLLKRIDRYSSGRYTASFLREPGDSTQRDDIIVLIGECADYDAFILLPRVLRWEGDLYAVTGWDSDKGEAYWKPSRLIAEVVS